MKRLCYACSVLILMASISLAAEPPVLLFSDITSGPASGNTDGAGGLTFSQHGAIVTIWGTHLGPAQADSSVSFKDSSGEELSAAHIYYWKNADGTLPSGPADLFTYHRMQEVAFSLPSATAHGSGKISVRVGGVDSNALDFTVRNGNIYFVKPTGDDTMGDGNWDTPWATLSYQSGAGGKTNEGDCVYATSGVQNGEAFQMRYDANSGTITEPVSFSVYPGSRINLTEIGFWNSPPYPEYCNFSKYSINTTGTGIASIKGMRAVGNEITGPNASGQSGAISGAKDGTSGVKCFGNFIHDFGLNDYSIRLHHVFYLTNRDGTPNEAYELGWNFLKGNHARGGLHNYDEGICGDFSGVIKVHDNVVIDQSGACFGAAGSGTGYDGTGCLKVPFDVYNNLFINCSQPPFDDAAISVTMSGTSGHFRFYNNTLYGWGHPGSSVEAVYIQDHGSESWNFQGTFDWMNNIVVNSHNLPFSHSTYFKTPESSSSNIWYSGDNGTPANAPLWDTTWAEQTSNPLLTNPENGDFTLQASSPAIDNGNAAVTAVVNRSLTGTPRPHGTAYDIGAFEYNSAGSQATTPDPQPSADQSNSGGCFLMTVID